MELLEGPALHSWDLSVETKINIDEMIYTLSPEDLPLLAGINGDGTPVLPRTGVDNTIFYWLEDETPVPIGTLVGNHTDVDTTLQLATGDGVKFIPGDGVRIDDEVCIITDVAVDTDIITVTRGSAVSTNSTAVAHTSGAAVVGLGTILSEGSLGSTNFIGRDKYSNYTQIFSKKIQATRTSQVIPKYGIQGNELLHQMAKTMRSLVMGVENACSYGVKHLVTATKVRQMGGLDYFITTNEDSTSPWLTIPSIVDQQQGAYDQGGMFNTVVSRPINFKALNNITGSERVQVQFDDSRRGRRRATVVTTEHGDVALARDRFLRTQDAFCLKSGNVVLRQLSPLVTEKLAKTDDTDTYSMLTECGLQVKGEAHMAKFTALDATATFPTTDLT